MPLQSPAGRRHRPRRLLAAAPAANIENIVSCLTGPYLTRRAARTPPWRGAVRLRPPYESRPPTVAETRKFPKMEIPWEIRIRIAKKYISFGDLIPSDETHWLPNKSTTKLWEVSDETSTVYLVRLRGSISMMAPLRTPPLPYALSSRWAYRRSASTFGTAIGVK